MSIPADRNWHRALPASEVSLTRLRTACPVGLPDGYFSLLGFSNGGEGPLPVQPLYFQLDPAEYAAEAIERGAHNEFLHGFVVIGSNGGGEYIAFDVRGVSPWPVVAIDMTNIDLDESIRQISPSFEDFLDLIGREKTEP